MRPLHPVVCHAASFEGQPRAESPFDIIFTLPEGFDCDEGRLLLVRHVSETARKTVRASILYSRERHAAQETS